MRRSTLLKPMRLSAPGRVAREGESGRWYGTRVSTVVLIRDDGECLFVERDVAVLDKDREPQHGTEERRFRFTSETG